MVPYNCSEIYKHTKPVLVFVHGSNEGEEVFNWILEASEEAGDDLDRGRVVWILRYVIQPSADSSWMKKDPFSNFGDERHKLTTRLEIQKDDIQAVLPIAKSWEVVNAAVLNGKQVSRPMKIFIVSRAGQVADVTLQASCRSLDESVLKVSSSCTSVYVDGSESRGSTNATIIIKYGTYEGAAEFTVWMPEFPLDIQLSDARLNQIKGWRVPNGLREYVCFFKFLNVFLLVTGVDLDHDDVDYFPLGSICFQSFPLWYFDDDVTMYHKCIKDILEAHKSLILKITGGKKRRWRKIKPETFSPFQSNRNLAVGIDKRDLLPVCGTVPKGVLRKKAVAMEKMHESSFLDVNNA
ncbi:Transmembrane protein [Orchesella cincta]|uniref:Transmembrane protein n=1 Tax=Orchesella cincta TaxID=48709 RepID=A0A1D2N0M7_ORCCI|nr:Transmembrane protein [Orchesella cincta]